MPGASILAVDLGKSRCRATIAGTLDGLIYDGPGTPGLASAEGVTAAHESIRAVLAANDAPYSVLSVGAAGAWTAPEAATALATRLAVETTTPVVVASDVVTAHAGALAGRRGVLLITGTGAAALGIDEHGARLIDGWGPELGDFGSGSWLGREALRALLRASVDEGDATELTAALADVTGARSSAQAQQALPPIEVRVQAWIAESGHLPRRLATLAPIVLEVAAAGDRVAGHIVDEAIRHLTETGARAAAQGDVALHGGLTESAWFRDRLEESLRRSGRTVVPSAGDALDGARLLAERADLPHERFVHRAE